MKKILSFILCAALTVSLFGCAKTAEVKQDDSPITVHVSMGGTQSYFVKIKEAVKEKLGIDLKFVYQQSCDTSNTINLQIKNNDMSADIVFTSAAVPNEYLKNSCLDYLMCTQITDYFTFSKVKEYTTDDGAVYQLPFSSKLIGITYNKTLLKELGCQEPETFEDMLKLKKVCDEKNILFAVSGGAATGHGFNWLFHLMGSQWISTLDGADWFSGFIKGTKTVDAFRKEASYFKKYAEAGLFGKFYNTEWNASTYYTKKRALFLYDITNSLYRQYRMNEDGTIYGATYEKDGSVKALKSPEGQFVCVNDAWVLYDKNDVLHENAERYDIPGARIDEFATIPWISEDGTNNRYTCYDNMFIVLNKKLGEKQESEKLKKITKVLEYLASDEATSIFSNANRDGYVAVNNFKITDDRLYYSYADKVNAGYIQPWYYILVDVDTLVNTGEKVNDYLAGGKTTFDDIIDTFDKFNTDHVNHQENNIAEIQKDFSYEELAELDAIVGAQNLQTVLDDNKIDEEVTVSMMLYTEKRGDLAPFSRNAFGPVCSELYAGGISESFLNTLIPSNGQSPVCIKMKGSEIKELVQSGFACSDFDTETEKYGPYPYAIVTKNNIEIVDGETYNVAVSIKSLPNDTYDFFLENNRIVMSPENNETPVNGDVHAGLVAYFKANPVVSPETLSWN